MLRLNKTLQLTLTDCKHEFRVSCCNVPYNRKKAKIKIREKIYDENGELVVSDEDIKRSIRRARVCVVDLALCNDWDYFGTITIDSSKHNVDNWEGVTNSLLKCFDNYKQNYALDLLYVVVPELGEEKGRLHFHFLISGLPRGCLDLNEHRKLDWFYMRERFGFVQIRRIRSNKIDRHRVARYCAKYVTKGSIRIVRNRYFCSHGLNRPKVTVKDNPCMALDMCEWLEDNGFFPYADFWRGKVYAVPVRVVKDFFEWRENRRKELLYRARNITPIESLENPFFEVFEQMSLFG